MKVLTKRKAVLTFYLLWNLTHLYETHSKHSSRSLNKGRRLLFEILLKYVRYLPLPIKW
jgi:hypothetical protein